MSVFDSRQETGSSVVQPAAVELQSQNHQITI